MRARKIKCNHYEGRLGSSIAVSGIPLDAQAGRELAEKRIGTCEAENKRHG